MKGKIVINGSKAREELLEGINTLADAVKVTLGPRGRHVAIERDFGPPLITKDGVTVARNIFLQDRAKNMGAQLIKSVAANSNSIAGDGTTTATVLAQEIFIEGSKRIAEGHNPVLIKRGIDLAVKLIVGRLKGISAPSSSKEAMKSVAVISANNDVHLGSLIADAIATVGENGVVSVEEATGTETRVEYRDGLKLDKGFMSEHFINNNSRLTADLEDAYIVPFHGKLNSLSEALPMLELLFNHNDGNKNQFLIICKDISQDMLGIIVANKIKHNFNCAVIKAPGFGDSCKAFLDDIAVLTGGKVFNPDDGVVFNGIQLEDLGRAKTISVGLNTTTIVGGYSNPDLVEKEIDDIQEQINSPGIFNHQIDVLTTRLARLNGVAAIFKVGGSTETEMKERKDRVEDAINAVKSAISEGVVPGGGSALIHALPVLSEYDTSNLIAEEVIGFEIIKRAVTAPFRQILANAGITDESVVNDYIDRIKNSNSPSGFDAFRLEFVDNMLTNGIMDPTKVVRSGLEHSSSAVGTLLTTEAVIHSIYREDFI